MPCRKELQAVPAIPLVWVINGAYLCHVVRGLAQSYIDGEWRVASGEWRGRRRVVGLL